MRTWIALLCAAGLAGGALASDMPAITDSGDIRYEDAIALIEDESPAASRQMALLIRNIEAALKVRGSDPDYLVLLARAYTRMSPQFGSLRGAQLAEEALKVKPGHLEALLYKAEQAARSGCRPCASELIEQAAQAGAPPARLHVLRAGLSMMESLNARANPGGSPYENDSRNPWQQALEELDQAAALENNAARKARIQRWIFEMQVQLGDAAKAKTAAEAAIAAQPEARSFIERYAGFLMHEGEVDRAAELAGKLTYYYGYPKAEETIGLALYLKWAHAWEKAPRARRTEELFEAAHQTYKNLPGILHTASGSEATAPVARAMILAGKVDVRSGDYRDQDGDTTLGNIVLSLSDLAFARRYAPSGPRPTAELRRLMAVLVSHGANPNAWVSRGREPMLAAAARSGQLETVKALLEAGARVNDRGATGTTALLAAAQSAHKEGAAEIAKLLVPLKADVNAVDDYRQSPLIAAARSGNPALVRLLLAHEADVRHRDEREYGPLEHAAQSGDMETVKALLAADIAVRDIVTGCGKTNAVRIAEQAGHKEIAALLRSRRREEA